MTGEEPVSLSVVVPTYNEAERIRTCLESVFDACRAADAVDTFEVILVDSNSTDRTVELASDYPITVLEIPDDDLTTPGAGRYVGGHHADGDVLLFVDGDMEVAEGWLSPALEHVRQDGVAAVDGHLNDVPEDATTESREWVNGVALYDADALADVGGFDPFLDSLEDVHLGMELNAEEYRLVRLPMVSAYHPGSDMITETFRRWENGYSRGSGQVLRRSLTAPGLAVEHFKRMRYRVVFGAWLAVGIASLATGAGVVLWLVGSLVGFAVVVSEREGVVDAAAYIAYKLSLLVGLVLGFLDEPKPREAFPLERVETVTVGTVHGGRPPEA